MSDLSFNLSFNLQMFSLLLMLFAIRLTLARIAAALEAQSARKE